MRLVAEFGWDVALRFEARLAPLRGIELFTFLSAKKYGQFSSS